jgi:hypothetical protein
LRSPSLDELDADIIILFRSAGGGLWEWEFNDFCTEFEYSMEKQEEKLKAFGIVIFFITKKLEGWNISLRRIEGMILRSWVREGK